MGVERDLVHVDEDGRVHAGRGPRGTPCFWPYTQSWRHLARQRGEALVDPVSAVARATVDRVTRALDVAGWTIEPSEGGVHVLWGRFLPHRMTTHAALGAAEERDHVRLWDFGGITVLAAHHEVRAEGGGHRVTSWERARREVAAALLPSGLDAHPEGPVVTLPGVRRLPWDGRIWRFSSS